MKKRTSKQQIMDMLNDEINSICNEISSYDELSHLEQVIFRNCACQLIMSAIVEDYILTLRENEMLKKKNKTLNEAKNVTILVK